MLFSNSFLLILFPNSELVEKVFASSPQANDVAISKSFYIIHSDCFSRYWRDAMTELGLFNIPSVWNTLITETLFQYSPTFI